MGTVSSVTYNADGTTSATVNAVSAGTVTITATSLSNGLTATYTLTVPDLVAPADVTNVKVMPNDKQLKITWTDPADKDLNKVQVSCDGQTVNVDKGIQQAVISNLTNGNSYNYTIYAIDTSNNISSGVSGTGTPKIPVFVSSIAVTGENGASTISTAGGMLNMQAAVLPDNADTKDVILTVTDQGTNKVTTNVSIDIRCTHSKR